METNLRPLTLGEILDRTAQLYRTNFLLFAGISAVNAGAALAVGLGQIGIQEWMRARHMTAHLTLVNLAIVVVQLLLIFIFSGMAVAANNRAVAWVYMGWPATVRGAYGTVLAKPGRYAWLMSLISFLAGWPLLVIYVGYFVTLYLVVRPTGKAALAAGAKTDPNTIMLVGLITLAFLCLVALGIAYAVFMGLRYSLAVPACVVEETTARGSIRRSIDLSQGARRRIFMLALLIGVISFGLAMISQGFFIAQIFRHHGALSAGMRSLQQVVQFFTNTFVGPMYAIGLTLFYYDQRVRKEGYDIEWMMQAAGMTAAAAEPGDAGPTEEVPASPAPLTGELATETPGNTHV
jgi:hypothetical protein